MDKKVIKILSEFRLEDDLNNSVSFKRRRFLSTETIFHSPKSELVVVSTNYAQMKKYALAGFQNSRLCLHLSKLKWEDDLLLILRVINFSRFSSQ